jgi:hypothetical protein
MNRNEIAAFIEFIKEQKVDEQKLIAKIEALRNDCEQF